MLASNFKDVDGQSKLQYRNWKHNAYTRDNKLCMVPDGSHGCVNGIEACNISIANTILLIKKLVFAVLNNTGPDLVVVQYQRLGFVTNTNLTNSVGLYNDD